jgi:hypothetical protein
MRSRVVKKLNEFEWRFCSPSSLEFCRNGVWVDDEFSVTTYHGDLVNILKR